MVPSCCMGGNLFNPLNSLEIVVRIYDTFGIILEIKNRFTKDLKESCWKCSD